MPAEFYAIRKCPGCGLRYPLVEGHPFGLSCPICRGETRLVLRRGLVTEPPAGPAPRAPGADVQAMLDNLRSAWNVGSMFRSADGLGITRLHLCGITPTPDNDAVRKTALGAEKTVAWSYAADPVDAARRIKMDGRRLWALELDQRAKSLEAIPDISDDDRILLIVGNEITGIDPEVLDLCDHILAIPMRGIKRSLNAAVAFGIAVYTLQSAPRSRG